MDLKSLPPQFIVFEGIDGAGKTTQLKKLSELLTDMGIDHITTREVGGTEMAEKIRDLMLSDYEEEVSGKTELLLAFAAREQHLKNTITPALKAGKWVLCDRYVDSTYTYQVVGRNLDNAQFFDLMVNVVGDMVPNLTLFIDINDNVALKRRAKRTGGGDRIDNEDPDYFKRVNATMRELGKLPSHKTINGEQPVYMVTGDVIAAINEHAEEVLDAIKKYGSSAIMSDVASTSS